MPLQTFPLNPVSGGGGGTPDDDSVTSAKILDGTILIADLNAAVTALIPSAGQKAGLVGTNGTPGSGNKFVTDSDSRNTDARALAVGQVISDTQHGNRSGGALHSDVIAAGASGFMSGADKTKLNGIAAGAQADHTALTNIGTNTHAAIDTFIASKAAINGLASLKANSTLAQNNDARAITGAMIELTPTISASASLSTIAGGISLGEQLVLAGSIAPAQVTADQNNYAPIDASSSAPLSRASVLVVNTDVSRNFTGLDSTGITSGTLIWWRNNGTVVHVLKHANGSSLAANRFTLPGSVDVTVPVNGSVLLRSLGASGWRALTVMVSPGTSGQIHYTDANGQFAAASRATIDTNNFALLVESTVAVPATLANAIKLFSNRSDSGMPLRFNWVGDIGASTHAFHAPGARDVNYIVPLGTTTVSTVGSRTDFTGTLAHPGVANTSNYTRRKRMQEQTGASAGTTARFKMADAITMRSMGFDAIFLDFGTPTLAATVRFFVGMQTVTTLGNAEPDTSTDCVLIGARSTDTNLFIFHNDNAGTCTAVDLGANFPVSTTSRFNARIYCAPSGNIVVEVVRLDSAFTAINTLTTNLTTVGTGLVPCVQINNVGNAADARIDTCGLFVFVQRSDVP